MRCDRRQTETRVSILLGCRAANGVRLAIDGNEPGFDAVEYQQVEVLDPGLLAASERDSIRAQLPDPKRSHPLPDVVDFHIADWRVELDPITREAKVVTKTSQGLAVAVEADRAQMDPVARELVVEPGVDGVESRGIGR